jgi:hypothetical protein
MYLVVSSRLIHQGLLLKRFKIIYQYTICLEAADGISDSFMQLHKVVQPSGMSQAVLHLVNIAPTVLRQRIFSTFHTMSRMNHAALSCSGQVTFRRIMSMDQKFDCYSTLNI